MKKDKGSLVFRAVELKTNPVSVGQLDLRGVEVAAPGELWFCT